MERGSSRVRKERAIGQTRCVSHVCLSNPVLYCIAVTNYRSYTGQDFKRVGLSTLTDILNVVAPPISEHEVIKVWLSHDMKGYDGVESLVYRALARVRI